jgi:hypothetical protein
MEEEREERGEGMNAKRKKAGKDKNGRKVEKFS